MVSGILSFYTKPVQVREDTVSVISIKRYTSEYGGSQLYTLQAAYYGVLNDELPTACLSVTSW